VSANNDLMFDGRNRVAEVAGGGRGIGRGIVWELGARGFSVVVNFRSDAASPGSVAAKPRPWALPARWSSRQTWLVVS